MCVGRLCRHGQQAGGTGGISVAGDLGLVEVMGEDVDVDERSGQPGRGYGEEHWRGKCKQQSPRKGSMWRVGTQPCEEEARGWLRATFEREACENGLKQQPDARAQREEVRAAGEGTL